MNVQVSEDGFAAHIEPAIAANPLHPENLLAACRVFQNDVNGANGVIGMASYVSWDAGAHWSSGGLLPGLVPDFDGNPAVTFDRTGTGYICGIAATTGTPRHGDALLWRTLDAGRTLLPPVTVISGGVGGLVDHCSIAAEPDGCAPVPRLYATAVLAATDGNRLVFTHSTDGARTFAPPSSPAGPTSAQAPVLTAAPNGCVCIVYLATAADGSASTSVLTAVSSIDYGRTFGAPTALASLSSLVPDFGSVLSAKSGPAVAADSRTGRLYAAVTSWDDASGTSRILLWTSADQGHTWTGPILIADSNSEVYLQPQLAIHNGTTGLSYYVANPATRLLDVRIHLFPHDRPSDGCIRRVTSQSFDPTLAPGTPPWIGNYQGLTATGDGFHPAWTDTRTGSAQIFTTAIAHPW